MNFSLRQLQYFVAAAEHGNITLAARSLHVSQPSVSAAVARLEELFGTQLLQRHPARGVSLTTAGRAFATEARSLLVHAEDVSARAADLGGALAGRLDVGCFVTLAPFYLPGLLKTFSRRHREIGVEIHEGTLDVLQKALATGACELALLYDIKLGETLAAEPMAALPPYALLPAGHRLAKAGGLSLADLAGEPFILLDLPHSRDYFVGLFARAGLEPRVVHRTPSFEMVRSMVANGFGYSILALRPAADVSYDGFPLIWRPLDDALPPLRIVLAHYRGTRLSARARAFTEHCLGFDAQEATPQGL